MLKKFINCHSYRSISESSIWRNLEKSKPNKIDCPSETLATQGQLLKFTPSKFQKRVLLLSGKFKSEKDIPPKISFETFDHAKSRLRIRVSNLLIVLAMCMFGFCVWIGKKKRKEGDSIIKRMLKEDRKILTGKYES